MNARGFLPVAASPPIVRNTASQILVYRLITATTAGLLFLFSTPSEATERQALTNHVPQIVKRLNLRPLGQIPNTNRLYLAIGLPLPDPKGLETFLQQLYDPVSPRYHQYLTPQQFADKFGPTEQDYKAVSDFAKANGLQVTGTHANRLLLDVQGFAADVEKAFQVKILKYQHPTEGRMFCAPDVEPSVPSGIKVLDISGLSSYARPRPLSRIVKPRQPESTPAPNAGSAGGQYIGYDFRAAYVPGSPLTGTGQSVALVQFDSYYPSDIALYETLAGLPSIALTNIYLDFYTGTIGSGNGEVSLDIEMVIAMAPGVSKIFLYEGNPNFPFFIPNDVLCRIANDNAASQISCSWVWTGGPKASTDNIFMQMASQGQSFFAASGDTDAYPGSSVDDARQYGTPSASAYVTSVGGTTLSTSGPTNDWVSETVWNWGVEFYPDNDGEGSSGGFSSYYAIPAWQQGVSMTNNQGSTTGRNFPDVALTADHVFVVYGNGNTNDWFGGTSCAAPLWAGFTALVNQQGAANSTPPVGFLNPAIYAVGTGTTYAACFHDITTGNNQWSNSASAYSAVAGYDLCTGWGTPTGTNLINALVGTLVPSPMIVPAGSTLLSENCLATNDAVDPGETVTVNLALQNVGTGNTSNLVAMLLATNGVALPSGPQTYGVLVAGGPAVAKPFTFTAHGTCGSDIFATLHLQDGTTDLATATFTFTLGASSPATNSFPNTGTITIPTSGLNGQASPYPSTISVPPLPGLIRKVTTTLSDLSHTWPADLDILLVGPDGQSVMLMSDAGGDDGVTPITNVTLTFDDDAAQSLPQTTQITSGTYKPTDYEPGDVLTSPAPAGPYGATLSVFNGSNPAGTWSLYVFDDYSQADGGKIAGGWSLTIVTATNTCCNINGPPVINAASISPANPATTNDLVANVTSAGDPDGDPITFSYQWQQSTDAVNFADISFTASTLPASVTIAGDSYRTIITPNDGKTNGAPFTTVSVLVAVDADGNGINDDWEVQYFGHIGINPTADADGTGQNNLFKYLAGLDPTNPASVFRLQINSITNQSTRLNLLFYPLVTGRIYTPQFSTDLSSSVWSPLTGYAGSTTNGNQIAITDTNATEPSKFYRIDISLP